MKKLKSFGEFIFESSTPSFNVNKVPLKTIKGSDYPNVEYKSLSGRDIGEDMINSALLQDIQNAAKIAGVRVLITTAKSDHKSHADYSRHPKGVAVDIAQIGDDSIAWGSLPGSGGASGKRPIVNTQFADAGDRLVSALIDMDYSLITDDPVLRKKYPESIIDGESGNTKTIIWKYDDTDRGNRAGNHYDHVHVSSTEKDPSVYDDTPDEEVKKFERGLRKIDTSLYGGYVNPITGATGSDHRTTILDVLNSKIIDTVQRSKYRY